MKSNYDSRTSKTLQRLEHHFQDHVFSKDNLSKLALVSLFLTLIDSIQSYYLQRVINVYSELNLIPSIFYSHGLLGYIIYVPLEFAVTFATLAVLWFWAAYVLWYHRNVSSKIHLFSRK